MDAPLVQAAAFIDSHQAPRTKAPLIAAYIAAVCGISLLCPGLLGSVVRSGTPKTGAQANRLDWLPSGAAVLDTKKTLSSPADIRDVSVEVDWSEFLARHDLLWAWEIAESFMLRPLSQELHRCGSAGDRQDCCIAAVAGDHDSINLAPCDSTSASQQWQTSVHKDGGVSLIVAANGFCLTSNSADNVSMAACGVGGQRWSLQSGGYVLSVPSGTSDNAGLCLAVITSGAFCTGTICPHEFTRQFSSGMPLGMMNCQNGDRSQLFIPYTLPSSDEASRPNFMPLTWATSAYVGNGVLGLRVQSEEGGFGELHFLVDNARLGAGGHRQPSGYFRLQMRSNSSRLQISMRQELHTAVLHGNITDLTAAAVILSFTCFVCADLSFPVVVCDFEWEPMSFEVEPEVLWIPAGETDAAWVLDSSHGSHMLYASVGDHCQIYGCVGNATAIVSLAHRIGHRDLLRKHIQWWEQYWPQSFVSIPVTPLEGLYYVQMYRFPSSQRELLHGLMGAFGPTGNYNLWGDYVFDMNEQVMYWIAAASNRPEISQPMQRYSEANPLEGGLWMFHNYIRQARFDDRDDLLRNVAWPRLVENIQGEVGKNETSPGKLTALDDGLYHFGVQGCWSPEYRCFPPFEHLDCGTKRDCNYGLAQVRWGITEALRLTETFNLSSNLSALGVDEDWWRSLLAGKLVWYPTDATGFRLDAECSFQCPHRHFSHLLQIYDLQLLEFSTMPGGNESLNALLHTSLDTWYRITCNESNWFNEECRGFTRCGIASMSAVTDRADAAAGNLTELLALLTPNGMYGEEVYFTHPDMFSPVSESAYCGVGTLHTMLLHTSRAGVLHILPGVPQTWDLSFHQLRAEGGALVSAVRRDRRIRFLRLLHAAGRVQLISFKEEAWRSSLSTIPSGISLRSIAPGLWEVELLGGQPVIIYPATDEPTDFVIAPVDGNTSERNLFGYRRAMAPLH